MTRSRQFARGAIVVARVPQVSGIALGGHWEGFGWLTKTRMVSTSRLRQVERQWRRVVFDRAIRPLIFVGLAAFAGVALVSVIPSLAQASRPVMHYVLPLWFAACVWLVASSYFLTAALCFAQRDKLTGAWMSAWVVLLTLLGLVAFRHILRS